MPRESTFNRSSSIAAAASNAPLRHKPCESLKSYLRLSAFICVHLRLFLLFRRFRTPSKIQSRQRLYFSALLGLF
jgi:hypothetical protein